MSYRANLTKTKIKKWQAILAVIIFVLAFLYVRELNNQAEYSFTIKSLEEEKYQKTEEIRSLTWEASTQRSLPILQGRANDLELVKPANVSFLELGLSTVASAE